MNKKATLIVVASIIILGFAILLALNEDRKQKTRSSALREFSATWRSALIEDQKTEAVRQYSETYTLNKPFSLWVGLGNVSADYPPGASGGSTVLKGRTPCEYVEDEIDKEIASDVENDEYLYALANEWFYQECYLE